MDALDVLGLLAVLVAVFVLAPISLYTLINFYQLRNVDLVKNRQKRLVYYMNTLTILSLLFNWAPVSRHVWEISMGSVLTQIIYIVDGSFIWSVFALFCMKTWLLLYDKQYHASLAAQTWKKQINQQYKSWYIINKNKWGNFDYIVKICLIPLICCIILESILESLVLLRFNIHSMVVLSIIWLPPSIIVMYGLKGFDDMFGIKQEIFYQIIVMIVIVIIHILQFLFQIQHILHGDDTLLSHRIDWLLAISVSSITLFLMSFLSTAYPIYLQKKHIQQHQLGSYVSSHIHKKSRKHSNNIADMLTVISYKKGFKAFVTHLVSEFATENILFVLELIQIKYEYNNSKKNDSLRIKIGDREACQTPRRLTAISNAMHHKQHIKSHLLNADNEQWGTVSFPIDLPRTELLTQNNNNLKEQLYALYIKYVKENSDYAINISYHTRQTLDLYFEPAGSAVENKNINQPVAVATNSILSRVQAFELFTSNTLSHNSVPPNTPRVNIHVNVADNKTVKTAKNTPTKTPHSTPRPTNSTPHPYDKTPSGSKSKTPTRSKSLKSISIGLPKGKIFQRTPTTKLPASLSTPIMENDSFPDMVDHMQSQSEHVQNRINNDIPMRDVEDSFSSYSPVINMNEKDIPEDFMVILDYNMDEKNEEEENELNEEKEKDKKLAIEVESNNNNNNNIDQKTNETDNNNNNEDVKENEDIFELFNIMDVACIEIILLMFHSYLRFINTRNGQTIVEGLIKQNNA